MRLITTREEAVQKLTEMLEDIKAISPSTNHFDPESGFVVLDEDHRGFRGRKAWELAEKWHIEEELSKLRHRDYALLYAPVDFMAPRKPRLLLKLAAYHGKFDIVLRYFDLLKQKDLPLVFHGLTETRGNSRLPEMSVKLLDRFPVMERAAAKIIASRRTLVKVFYNAVKHFGPSLYRWSKISDDRTRCYSELIELGCPADERALLRAIRDLQGHIIGGLLLRGAQVTEKVQEKAEKRYLHWRLLSEEQITALVQKYGIDPASLDDDYPGDSFGGLIRKWLKILKHGHGAFPHLYYSHYGRVFKGILLRIAEVEPQIAEQLAAKV